jgi:hypothetical protein
MFSPLVFMLLTIVTVFGVGLFIAYGKDKGWDKPQPSDKK